MARKKKTLQEPKVISQRTSWEDEGGVICFEAATLKCSCGDILDLPDVWENTCQVCGRKYDLNGEPREL